MAKPKKSSKPKGVSTGVSTRSRALGRSAGAAALLGPTREWLPRAVVATLAGMLSVYFLFGYCVWAPLLVAPVLAGVIVALIAEDPIVAVGAGVLGGLVGGLVAANDFTVASLNAQLQAMPPYANPDVIIPQLYHDFLQPLMQAPLTVTTPASGPMSVVLAAVLLTPLCAAGIAWLLRSLGDRKFAENVAGWVVVSALAVILIGTSWNAATTFRESLGQRMENGSYRFDAVIYLRAYEGMLDGGGYYQSLLKAGAGDARLIKENAVRNGKFYSFISSPTLAREPWAFYLWRFAAPQGAPGVFLLSLLVCAASMLALHWGLRRTSFAASLIAPVLLLPMFLFLTAWYNIFFPDFWAGIAMLVSLAFLAREKVIGAALFALAAALFRETLVFWLIAVVVYSALRAKSSRTGIRDLACAGGSFVVFVGLYALHYFQASQIIAAQANSGAGGFLARLQDSASASLVGKFLAPFSYMMWPYGFFRFSGVVLVVAGLIGWALSFPDKRTLRWTIFGYGAVWLTYYATIGAASSYWGQQVLPFYLVGVAMLVASPIWLFASESTDSPNA